jgi:hypothetical protein
MDMRALEITDLLWQADASGQRAPVARASAVERLTGLGQYRAARIVARMPAIIARDALASAFAILSVVAVLAVEPVADSACGGGRNARHGSGRPTGRQNLRPSPGSHISAQSGWRGRRGDQDSC